MINSVNPHWSYIIVLYSKSKILYFGELLRYDLDLVYLNFWSKLREISFCKTSMEIFQTHNLERDFLNSQLSAGPER